MPTLEIRIPISANAPYFRMARCLLESIRQFGGPIARNARCVFTVSRDEPQRPLENECPWAENYRAEFQWVAPEAFARDSYTATAYARYGIESDADVVAMMDADTLVAGDFDDAVMRAHREQRHLGVIAHISPFLFPRHVDTPSRIWWTRLFEAAGLPTPEMEFTHTNWGAGSPPAEHATCPPNYNFGFVLCPRWHAERIGTSFECELATVDQVLNCHFRYQVAHSLSLFRHELDYGVLPIEYNFPLANLPDGISVDDIRVFHYLADGEIHKGYFYSENTLVYCLQRTDLSPAGQVFQNRLYSVFEYIFESES